MNTYKITIKMINGEELTYIEQNVNSLEHNLRQFENYMSRDSFIIDTTDGIVIIKTCNIVSVIFKNESIKGMSDIT